eukprot:gnl/TRDRNA2_/TRDRNA2_200337_c0_seq1.p1 gnl/TRDRNA2_/TRDRNA2_200337_c0~~gnl/TRDRNA2_/TRDRNA2_200337_c0_seq1.p1  ORF type:complete len:526 (-),score=75.64 gnl/TRDRNA2_/TRDRNA2_200337_c0_seq1:91-1668(-)
MARLPPWRRPPPRCAALAAVVASSGALGANASNSAGVVARSDASGSLCDSQVPVQGSHVWAGSDIAFECSAPAGLQPCEGGKSCCCLARTFWVAELRRCVWCRVDVKEALGQLPGSSSVALVVRPYAQTAVTCVAAPEGTKLHSREDMKVAANKAYVKSCPPDSGCTVQLSHLQHAMQYRAWCLIDQGGADDLSPPGGLLVATRAVPLHWLLRADRPPTHDAIYTSAWPQLECDVICTVRDVVRNEVHRSHKSCPQAGCNLTIGNLLPNSQYELRCEGGDVPQLEVPRFVRTRSAPLNFVGVEATSSGSVAVQLRPSTNSEALCAAFKLQEAAAQRGAGEQSIVLAKAADAVVEAWMISRASNKRAQWCTGSDVGCFVTISGLKPATDYTVACVPTGGRDNDVTPTKGAPVTTWVGLTSLQMSREKLAMLLLGVYLFASSFIFGAFMGRYHWEANCDFHDARKMIFSKQQEAAPLWPSRFGEGRCSVCTFELIRAVGLFHLTALVIYMTLVLPIYASFAYHRDWV